MVTNKYLSEYNSSYMWPPRKNSAKQQRSVGFMVLNVGPIKKWKDNMVRQKVGEKNVEDKNDEVNY